MEIIKTLIDFMNIQSSKTVSLQPGTQLSDAIISPDYFSMHNCNCSVGTISLPSLDYTDYCKGAELSADYLVSSPTNPFSSVYDTSSFICEQPREQDLLIEVFHSYPYRHRESDTQSSVSTLLPLDLCTPV